MDQIHTTLAFVAANYLSPRALRCAINQNYDGNNPTWAAMKRWMTSIWGWKKLKGAARSDRRVRSGCSDRPSPSPRHIKLCNIRTTSAVHARVRPTAGPAKVCPDIGYFYYLAAERRGRATSVRACFPSHHLISWDTNVMRCQRARWTGWPMSLAVNLYFFSFLSSMQILNILFPKINTAYEHSNIKNITRYKLDRNIST